MNYLYGKSTASVMISAALAVRLFIGMAVDAPAAMNASWMCPIIGVIIYLPLAFTISHAERAGNANAWANASSALPSPLKRIWQASFALLLAGDAALSVRLTASSSNIIALGDMTVHLLIVPLGVVIAAVVWMGGDSLGDAVRIILRTLPLFALIVLLVQIAGYKPSWLTPLLGSGAYDILRGGIYCAGCMALMSLVYLPAVPDRGRQRFLLRVIIATIGVSVLLATQQMCHPVMPFNEFTRAARIELVLSNGRMSLYPQFILNVLWYGGLLILLSVESAGSAAYLHLIFPKIKPWVLSLITAGSISAAAIFNPNWLKRSSQLTGMLFPIIGVLFALPVIITVFRGNGKCINSK